MTNVLKWAPIMGRYDERKSTIIFKGGVVPRTPETDQEGSEVGLFICNKNFSEGTISVEVKIDQVTDNTAAEIVLYYDPENKWNLNVGLTAYNQFSIRNYSNVRWTTHSTAGAADALIPKKKYHLGARLSGSTVAFYCDEVEVTRATLPFSLPQSQVGLFAVNKTDIEFSNFNVQPIEPKAFVVMQFSSPYDEVYSEVIKTVCQNENIDVNRIDEQSGPGMIIQDINNAFRDAKVVIADVSPNNANVFYEVGFAHALNKPTILLAEKGTKLPFDVSPFRVLFYENSIAGKRVFEDGLKNHLRAVLQQSPRRSD